MKEQIKGRGKYNYAASETPSMKLEVKLSIQGLETRIMGTWGPGDVPNPSSHSAIRAECLKPHWGGGTNSKYSSHCFFFFFPLHTYFRKCADDTPSFGP